MIYSPMTKKAMKISYDAHSGQTDRSGIPYVFHPIHLAEQMNDEDSVIVALLHDVVEDTNLTFEDIEKYGFNSSVIEALKCLTHDKRIPYFDYIVNIGKNPIARKVKIADLKHNSNLTRLDNMTEKDIERTAKYNDCLSYLESLDASYKR